MTGSLVDVVVSCLEENDHRSRATQAAALLSGPLDPLLAEAAALREQLADAREERDEALAELEGYAARKRADQENSPSMAADAMRLASEALSKWAAHFPKAHPVQGWVVQAIKGLDYARETETRATAAEHALAAERERADRAETRCQQIEAEAIAMHGANQNLRKEMNTLRDQISELATILMQKGEPSHG